MVGNFRHRLARSICYYILYYLHEYCGTVPRDVQWFVYSNTERTPKSPGGQVGVRCPRIHGETVALSLVSLAALIGKGLVAHAHIFFTRRDGTTYCTYG